MTRLSTNGLIMSSAFASAAYDDINRKLTPTLSKDQELYSHFIGAWLAIPYRIRAVHDYSERFTKLVVKYGPTPTSEIRYEQERELFGFFSNGFSAFDAYAFAMFSVCSILSPQKFRMRSEKDLRAINLRSLSKHLKLTFPNETISFELTQIASDPAVDEWFAMRNLLTHRSAPSRAISLNVGSLPTADFKTSSLVMPINTTTTASRELVFCKLVSRALETARIFVFKYFD